MAIFTPGERLEQIPLDVWDFTRERGVDLSGDMLCNPDWTPELEVEGGEVEHMIQRNGSEYRSSRIDYYKDSIVQASRIITSVAAGERTEITYWSLDAPQRTVAIHRGVGMLLLANPRLEWASAIPLSEQFTDQTVIEPGLIYAFYAAPDVDDSHLVVSELWKDPHPGLKRFRTVFPAGSDSVRTSHDGVVSLPPRFSDPLRN